MEFRVTRRRGRCRVPSPPTLLPLPELGESTVTRTFDFGQTAASWTINGQVFDHDRFDAQPVLDSTETWVLHNTSTAVHTSICTTSISNA